jgi:hypothetical protein
VIVKETSDEQKLITNRAFISKLNMVLVQVKKEKEKKTCFLLVSQ